MTEKRFQWIFIKDNELELRDNGIVKRFNNERLEELLNELHEENQDLHKKEVELGQNYLRLLEENEQLKQQIGEFKYSKKRLRENNKDLELGIRNLRKSFENLDNMRVEHIRFLQKRMKKYGISIYYNDDDGDV